MQRTRTPKMHGTKETPVLTQNKAKKSKNTNIHRDEERTR